MICAAEAAYTAAGLAEVEGFANTAAFEWHRCAMSLPRSRRVARRAARVAALPELGAAWRDGQLTGDQVELVASLVPERHVERFGKTVAETIEILGPLTAHQTGTVLRHWVKAADAFAEKTIALLADSRERALLSTAGVRSVAAYDDRRYVDATVATILGQKR